MGLRNFIILILTVKRRPPEKNEMGGACSTYGGKERCLQDFGGET
jgi:hypothetical protein